MGIFKKNPVTAQLDDLVATSLAAPSFAAGAAGWTSTHYQNKLEQIAHYNNLLVRSGMDASQANRIIGNLMKQLEEERAKSMAGPQTSYDASAPLNWNAGRDPNSSSPRRPSRYTKNKFFADAGMEPLVLLAARLRMPVVSNPSADLSMAFAPIEYIEVVINERTARIFYVLNDESNTLEEDAKVFPSDDLVAQFHLLMAVQPK